MNPFALPFLQAALAAGLLAGNVLAALGVFILARRVAFSGLAAAQLAALGAAAAAVAGLHQAGFAVAFAAVAAGLGLLPWLSRTSRVPPESWVASLYVLGAAAAVILLAKTPLGEAHTLSIFFGNVLALGETEVLEGLALFAAAALCLGAFFHRWLWLSLDPLAARIAGVPAGAAEAAFTLLLAAALTVSIHLFGVLLAFAYLLLPGTAGLLAGRRVRSVFAWTALAASAATVAGVALSFLSDLPTGPTIAALLAAAAAGARLLRP